MSKKVKLLDDIDLGVHRLVVPQYTDGTGWLNTTNNKTMMAGGDNWSCLQTQDNDGKKLYRLQCDRGSIRYYISTDGLTWEENYIVPQIIIKNKQITSDAAGNCRLEINDSKYIMVSCQNISTYFNGIISYYAYNGSYYAHLASWDGTAASNVTTTIKVVYFKV